jgi:hypothetical protein
MKKIILLIMALLLVTLVLALPPPPPSPGGFGDAGDEELPPAPTVASPEEVPTPVVINSDTSEIRERIAVLENKGPSVLVLVSLGLDIILLGLVIYLLFRRPKMPMYQQYPQQ